MDLKDLLCVELEEYAEQGKMKGKMSAGDLETIHKLTDTVKNIMKINVLSDEMDDGGSSYEGGSSYARGGGRGRGRNARRDSMGRYASRGGSSYDGGYSDEGGSSYRGGSSYEGGQGGGNMGGRGGQGGNMGGGSSYRRGGNSYRGGASYAYSREGAKDYMMDKIEEMMDEAENGKQREALQKCMQALERA